MTTLVLLARHATHTDYGRRLSGRSDAPLVNDGRLAAARLGDRLSAAGIGAIRSSPCLRARETAAAVAARTGVPVEIAPALDEIDFGDWTGASFDALEADPRWRTWNEARATARVPGGESMAEATARAVGEVEAAAASGIVTLLVTHCDIIRGVVAHYLGLALDHLLRFDVDPASLTTLMVGDWGGRVVALNERG